MGKVIQLKKPELQYILPCSKCGSMVFAIVCEGDQISSIVCPTEDCETVYDFTDEGLEIPI